MYLPFSPIAGHHLPGSSHYQLILNFDWKYCQNFAEKLQVTSEPFESLEIFFCARAESRAHEGVRYASINACVREIRKKIPSLKYISPYERFVGSPAKSPFKELFIGNKNLAHKLKVMSDRGGVNKNLKDQECKRGNCSKRPPIPYVPVVDEVQEKLAENNSEGRTFKISLSNDTEFRAGVWFYGTPEQFLCHVKQALAALDRMGLFSETKRLFLAHKAHLDEVETVDSDLSLEDNGQRWGKMASALI